MSQSASQTVLTGPGQGVITDLYGVAWQISDAGSVVAGASTDADAQPVVQLTFIGGNIWRQTTDLRWSCKTHPHDPWGSKTHVSPLPGHPTESSQVIDAFSSGNQAVLTAIAALKADFDTWKAKPAPTPSPAQILQAITALQTDMDTRLGSIDALLGFDHTTQVNLLGQISEAQAAALAAENSNQNVLVTALNQIQTTLTANQSAVVASLTQIVNAVTTSSPDQAVLVGMLNQIISDIAGAASPLPALAILQKDFTNLTETLNSIASGISAKLQEILLLDDPQANAAMVAAVAIIETDVVQILALLKAHYSPERLVLDIAHGTSKPQPSPSRAGP